MSEFNVGDKVISKDSCYSGKEVGVIVGIDPKAKASGKYLVKFNSIKGLEYELFCNNPDLIVEPYEGYAMWLDDSEKVVKVEDFGCFVELWSGCEGLVHVSQLANERVNKPSDVVKVGDNILVKCLGFDQRGRLNLSRKEALSNTKKEKESNDNSEDTKESKTRKKLFKKGE